MFQKLLSHFRKPQRQQLSGLIVVIVVAAIGVGLLVGSHAATPYASINAVNGAPAGGAAAQTCSGSSASTGQCVVFGPANTSGGGIGDTGKINMLLVEGGENDNLFNSTITSTGKTLVASRFLRGLVYTPGWDNKLSWFPNALFYFDAYKIANDSTGTAFINQMGHSDYVMRDMAGNPLYIPFGCSNGSCPQYAANFANPAYRTYFISQIEAVLAKHPYKGVWLDDVNLLMRVGDNNGNEVAPRDPATQQPMTSDAWAQYMADFMKQIHDTLAKDYPGVEIAHNSLWYAGGVNSSDKAFQASVQEEIQSATYVVKESAVSGDSGLTGGSGTFSLNALFSFADSVHNLGSHFIYYSDGTTNDTQREYDEAAYLLTNNGGDLLANESGQLLPDSSGNLTTNWWAPFGDDLGPALTDSKGNPLPRHTLSNNLIERDFQHGMALLNPPGNSTVTQSLGGTYTNTSGQQVTSVTLSAKQGAVLTK